ncbi:hypothetical protein [Terribacillus saccharophilus]|nr:hypothetical protein [Terribacillus saccharophilus]
MSEKMKTGGRYHFYSSNKTETYCRQDRKQFIDQPAWRNQP